MSNISKSDIFNIKFQKKPFMNFIWFSVLLFQFGGFLNFFNRKNMKMKKQYFNNYIFAFLYFSFFTRVLNNK